VRAREVDPARSSSIESVLASWSREVSGRRFNKEPRATDEEYALACSARQAPLLSDASTPDDRAAATIFARVQTALRSAARPRAYLSHVGRAVRALERYLAADGSFESRIAAGVYDAWLGRSADDDDLVWSLVERYANEYFAET
jgi:hypothetical protein